MQKYNIIYRFFASNLRVKSEMKHCRKILAPEMESYFTENVVISNVCDAPIS